MFEKIDALKLDENVFDLIGSRWMLITAGTPDHFNMMTASWGGFGVIWGRNICWCVVRPQRYTYGFMESADVFTLSFFDEQYRKALQFCGSVSGRSTNKAEEAGLTPVAGTLAGTTCFDEARLVIECRKIYFQDIDPANFLDPLIHENYLEKDYHRMYIGQVMNCMSRK